MTKISKDLRDRNGELQNEVSYLNYTSLNKLEKIHFTFDKHGKVSLNSKLISDRNQKLADVSKTNCHSERDYKNDLLKQRK